MIVKKVTRMNKISSLSIFFPVHNEQETIATLIMEADNIAQIVSDDYEIIVVDDGSTDESIHIVQKLSEQNPKIKIVCHETNQGYGAALSTGIKASEKDYIFFTDSDNQFDIRQLSQFISYIHSFDAIIGYREDRQDSFWRIVLGKIWNMIINISLNLKTKDVDCAFKLFRHSSLKSIKLVSKGAAASPELMLRLKGKAKKIKQLPVTHKKRLHGSASGANWVVIATAVKELTKLIITYRFGQIKKRLS